MKRLNYYQVHKNKKQLNKKIKPIDSLGIKITYQNGSDFHKAFVNMPEKTYTDKEVSKFILEIENYQKKEKYLKRVNN